MKNKPSLNGFLSVLLFASAALQAHAIDASTTSAPVGSSVTVSFDGHNGVIWQVDALAYQGPYSGSVDMVVVSPSGNEVASFWVYSWAELLYSPNVWLRAGAGSGTFTLSETGTYTVKLVKQIWNEDGNWNPSAVDHSITITSTALQQPVTFSPSPLSFTYDGSAHGPDAHAYPQDATFSTSGTATAVNAGTYPLRYDGSGNYTGLWEGTWTITKGDQSISISPSSSTITAGQSVSFSASGGRTGNYSWGGSASGGGATNLVTFNSAGTFSVTVQDIGDGNWNASNTAVATITVTSANRAPSVAWADIPTTFYYGSTQYARASGSDADGNLTRIVVEYAVNGGAWQSYTDTSFSATGSYTSPATPFTVGITPGNTYSFRAQAFDAAGAASGWIYANNYSPTNRPPTASFSLSGERAIGQTITVTVNVGDPDNNYSFANLWVSTPLRGWVTIKADNSTVVSGAASSANSVASAPGSYSRTFAFTPTDGAGNYTFALAAWDSPGLRTDAPNQVIAVTKGTQAAVTSAGGSVPYGTTFTAVPAGGSGTGSYTFELVAGGTATGGAVSSSGVVSSSSVGTVLFRVSRQADGSYNTSAWSPTYSVTFTPLSVTFTVSPTSFNYDGSPHGPTITPSIPAATFSTAGTPSATAVGSYAVTATASGNYTGSSGSVPWTIAQVTYTLTTAASGPGTVTPGGNYNSGNSVSISATPTAAGRFVGWSGDGSGLTNPLLVTMDRDKSITALFAAKLAQTIAFNPPASIRLDANNSAVLGLTASASSGLPVRFTLLSGPATLSGSTLTFTGPGTVTVQADQDGDATYAAAPSVVRSISSVAGARLKQSQQADELSDKNKTGSNMVRDRP